MTVPDLQTLGWLVEEWRSTPEVVCLIADLKEELGASEQPFLGRPLPDSVVRGRLPQGIASAWVFVLRASHRNPTHLHPNSTQYTATIQGGGIGYLGGQEVTLGIFDVAHPAETIYAIPRGMPHAFDTGPDGLVVVSFHTVAPAELVEIEVGTARSRTYVAGTGTRPGP